MFNDLFANGGLSLDRLRSFCSFAEAGGVTKAAGGNTNRQSQFSRQIKDLETFFATKLTQRRGKQIVLSPAGIRLAKITRESFAGFQDFYRTCKNAPMEFSIGSGDALLQWVFFQQLAPLYDAVPGVAFRVFNLRTLDIAEQVNDLRLDFGLIRKNAISPLHKCEPLGTMTFSLFVPTKLLTAKKKADWKTVLSKIPLATISGEGMFRESLEKEAAKAGVQLNCTLSCSSFPQAAKALQSERYAAILPSIASAEFDKTHFLPIAVPFLQRQARDICLIWNPRTENLRPDITSVKTQLVKFLSLSKMRQ